MVDADVPVEAKPEPAAPPAERPRRITILGATGSIGTSTLAVIGERPGDFAVEAVTAFGNAESLARVAKAAGAKLAVIADRSAYDALRGALAGTGIEAAAGAAAIEEAAARPVDVVVAGIVGAAGLAPAFAAIGAGSTVALANKECLVCAGDLFMGEARRVGVDVLPVDSEHNAIFQVLDRASLDLVDKIILTASGGPFREWTREAMMNASPAEAVKHPNWSMGPKISVDSATLGSSLSSPTTSSASRPTGSTWSSIRSRSSTASSPIATARSSPRWACPTCACRLLTACPGRSGAGSPGLPSISPSSAVSTSPGPISSAFRR